MSAPILALVPWSWAAYVAMTTAAPTTTKQLHVELRHGSCTTAKGALAFDVETADTDPARERGLGFRTKPLGAKEGMVFVYQTPGPRTFWMKETHIPLAIFYFDGAGKLLSSTEMPVERDPSNPAKLYPEPGPVSAILEVRRGTTKRAKSHQLDILCIPAGG